MGTLVLFLILEGMLSVFTIENNVCLLWAYRIWPLLCWGRFLLCPFFEKFFFKIINGCWILSKAFDIYYHMVFIFQFVNIVYHIDWFTYIEDSLHSRNKRSLIVGVWAFWCVAEFCSLEFCWGFLHLCSPVLLACNFLFLW